VQSVCVVCISFPDNLVHLRLSLSSAVFAPVFHTNHKSTIVLYPSPPALDVCGNSDLAALCHVLGLEVCDALEPKDEGDSAPLRGTVTHAAPEVGV
jgi:hypothetical protein